MAGFSLRGHLLGAQNPVTTHEIIDDSETFTVGDAVLMVNGYAQVCDANERVFGICIAIVDKNGIDLDSTQSDNYDGTWTSSTQTYVAASDNTTDKQIKAVIVADPFALWYNDADASLTQAMEKEFFSLIDEDQIDGDTNSQTVGEFQLWKRDPDGDSDASKGIFRITSWQGDSFEPET
jgi:hypothetical protein